MDLQLYRFRIGTFVPNFKKKKSYFRRVKFRKKLSKNDAFYENIGPMDLSSIDNIALDNKYVKSPFFAKKKSGKGNFFYIQQRKRQKKYRKSLYFAQAVFSWILIVMTFIFSVFITQTTTNMNFGQNYSQMVKSPLYWSKTFFGSN